MVNTVTLNPAVDRVLYLNTLIKGTTNRIRHVTEVVGGKGTHVSINLRLLGSDNRAFGIAYGELGKRIIAYLEDADVTAEFVYRTEKNSRMNYVMVEDNNDCTLIAEKGVELEQEDLREVVSRLEDRIENGDFLVLSGDASNSPDPRVYNLILDKLQRKNLKVFIDTSGPTLLQCIETRPFLIKPNLHELSLLCKREVSAAEDDVVSAIGGLEGYGIDIIAVSMGAEGSIVKSTSGMFRARPPEVNIKNTIGCGDSFLAGMINGLEVGMPIEETIRLATAVSAATAESPLTVGFDRSRAAALMDKCLVARIG